MEGSDRGGHPSTSYGSGHRGGTGIGRAVARRLSAEGLRVALSARTEADLRHTAESCQGETLVVPADITGPGAVDDVFAQVEQTWSPVDVLVANAGAGTSAPLVRTTDEQWQHMLDLNLTVPFRCLRRAVPSMTERGYGRVVVLASIAAKTGEPYLCVSNGAVTGQGVNVDGGAVQS
jgi:NAD(P)-dependent dehydrogenase (short-subunit alcohol dehydrogenase family)